LFGRNLSEEIVIKPANLSNQILLNSFCETVEYIRKTFYGGDFDGQEKKELGAAKSCRHN
jgi:hypothetical protein